MHSQSDFLAILYRLKSSFGYAVLVAIPLTVTYTRPYCQPCWIVDALLSLACLKNKPFGS